MSSPTCTVNGSSSTGGVNVTAGSTVTVQLVDLTADRWSLTCLGTDELSSSPTITINQTTKTATFTAGSAGAAYVLRSQVNGGIGTNGQVDASLTTTMTVYVLTAAGNRVIAFNETTEGNAVAGWLAQVNPVIRGGATVVTSTIYDATAGASKSKKVASLTRTSTTDATPTNIVQVLGNVSPILGTDAPTLGSAIVFVRAHAIAKKATTDEEFSAACTRAFRITAAGAVTAVAATIADAGSSFASAGAAGMTVDIGIAGAKIVVTITGRAAETWRWSAIVDASFTTNAA